MPFMRSLTSLAFALLLAVNASAQAPSEPAAAPDVEVSKVGWQKEKYVPALYDDPMRANQEHADLERDQKETIRQNESRNRSG